MFCGSAKMTQRKWGSDPKSGKRDLTLNGVAAVTDS